MDARTFDRVKLPSRHVTEGPHRAMHRSSDATANECSVISSLFDVAEIFKSTPYVSGLKPDERHVAGGLFESGGFPLLMRAVDGGRFGVAGMERREDRDRCGR